MDTLLSHEATGAVNGSEAMQLTLVGHMSLTTWMQCIQITFILHTFLLYTAYFLNGRKVSTYWKEATIVLIDYFKQPWVYKMFGSEAETKLFSHDVSL